MMFIFVQILEVFRRNVLTNHPCLKVILRLWSRKFRTHFKILMANRLFFSGTSLLIRTIVVSLTLTEVFKVNNLRIWLLKVANKILAKEDKPVAQRNWYVLIIWRHLFPVGYVNEITRDHVSVTLLWKLRTTNRHSLSRLSKTQMTNKASLFYI